MLHAISCCAIFKTSNTLQILYMTLSNILISPDLYQIHKEIYFMCLREKPPDLNQCISGNGMEVNLLRLSINLEGKHSLHLCVHGVCGSILCWLY